MLGWIRKQYELEPKSLLQSPAPDDSRVAVALRFSPPALGSPEDPNVLRGLSARPARPYLYHYPGQALAIPCFRIPIRAEHYLLRNGERHSQLLRVPSDKHHRE